ncbi:MAG TPA: VOC family protein [Ktedonobacterales bacterium]|nr:VOC family protein [Ktedonobacterales bacterium]
MSGNVLRKIDCVMIRVDDVAAAARYYERVFGLLLQWSGDDAIGLRFPDSDAEIVLHRDDDIPGPVEVYYLVDDVIAAVDAAVSQGCEFLTPPFDITVGKCAVIRDPFGVRLCLLDLTKGLRPLNLAPDAAQGSDQ